MYINEKLLEAFKNISCEGQFDKSLKEVGTYYFRKNNYFARLQVLIKNATIEDACFKAVSCPTILCSLDVVCKKIKGSLLSEYKNKFSNSTIAEQLDLKNAPTVSLVVAEEIVDGAIQNWMQKNLV